MGKENTAALGGAIPLGNSADLSGANLDGANLEGATGITNEELEKQAASLKSTIMPDGKPRS